MAKKVNLEEIARILERQEILELEDVKIKGDVELELSSGIRGVSETGAIQVSQIIGQGAMQIALSLLNFAKSIGYPVEGTLQQFFAPPTPAEVPVPAPVPPVVEELIPTKFEVSKQKWTGQIQEVTLGATSSEGGTRGETVTIGGEKTSVYYNFEELMLHPPAIAIDCFDMPIPLAKAVRERYEDVMNDPGEWAKKNVEKFDADLVTVHLISTDPMIKDTEPKEAAKTVEKVLQSVKVPIIIGGSGNPDKDPAVLEAAAEVAAGEKCLIASANLSMDYERIAKAAMNNGHALLAWTQLNINDQKRLNRLLFKLGVKGEDLIMDPTTAALGYGLDYAFTNIERMKISALKGDVELAFPISCGVTNAWGAREAWMKKSPLKDDSSWGPREYRGPLFEIVTGFTLAIAGGNMFMMMHPEAAATVKEVTKTLFGAKEVQPVDIENWITFEV